ncbi:MULTISPECIES: prefoldin subunit beta [Pyrobaculum]|uniref:Prefoldin subunit beta n=3 Tax=Pyrobaculum TaxID=2276 RepID=PFDB_PYRAR|nr:prefoldin subunit beta [Pyrobaculum arsenaticum]A4WM72.1 RecName: Full=Prefoldin subunit beta; AltName: Full=GimC subunit beta [Pyrobaculum arsenaticum DSM 13514]AFA38208.1 prefoldin, beta subunit, archaeal [Pyrobaculum oguniense TE7]ABP51489.1 prefoldin, beta subunit [Pyrobaculum arsenaticum DSM 13514]MCY0890966.1 prefoldin subunit beta [Pyrobaculum arsenaticum]NYR16542.1 prefoldin subunit beta [Pyrobaculum arsenaticum]
MAQIPPSLQDMVNRFNQAQAQLQSVLLRKQQYEAELKEVDKAISEIEKLSPDAKIFKNVGNFLVPQTRDAALQELKERKELLELHVKTLSRQETMLREQLDKLRDEINKELARLKGGEAAKGGG